MARLPRTERLPLAARKDIRDSWELRKGDYEESLSRILDQPWTIVVDPWAIHPYSQGSWCESSIGCVIASYVEGAFDRLRDFFDQNGNEARDEINEICSAHVLTIDYDDTNTVSYCGVKVSPERQLVILFSGNNLGTNASDAANSNNLTKALNDAPSLRPMNFTARNSIRNGYNPRIEQIQQKLKEMLQQDVSLVPNFETNFEKLTGNNNASSGWEWTFGNAHLAYFEGLALQLQYGKFGEDDMLREGLLETVDKHAVHIRVVDQIKGSYNEAVVEDGILYLQTTPKTFGVNTSNVASNVISIL
ncbi:unnamed protein product [Fusarium graminearum]|nr:unnamed protein product [Fusarium graminearum]